MKSAFLLLAVALSGCGKHGKVIVIGVDGMDPGFVERHWDALPNLKRLRAQGSFSRLATTTPPQSPVAWSTFITGLDPANHGIFDFVHRDPVTHELYLSTDKTVEPRFTIPLGPYRLPLSGAHVESLRKGKAFWQTLSERGVPVTIVRIPANYPPLKYGRELAGMGTPDLRGTQGTFTYYEGDTVNGHASVRVEGPPNPLRKDRTYTAVTIEVDVDPERPFARLAIGKELAILKEGEWSGWLKADFPLLPRFVSTRGMIRVFPKQLHPKLDLYISPVNIDPAKPALPISSPESFAKGFGDFYTLGIPEDTSALRKGVFNLPEFLSQTRLVLADEQRLLSDTLNDFDDGFLFFYFSSVDQNSHILWGKHDAELLKYYRAVDRSIGEAMRREPDAALVVMSDHGFSTFDRAVNLNTWLLRQGWGRTEAYAVGLNALYLQGADRTEVKRRLMELRDPENGAAVITSVTEIHPSQENRPIAPDLIVGYSPGYRASWQTGLGEVPDMVFETNTDAWIADHCIDAAAVPGVLITNRSLSLPNPSLKNLSGAILKLFHEAH